MSVRLLPYQRAAVLSRERFTWNCWARQTGKSFTFSLRRLLRGMARNRHQIILSAGARQSREVMEKLRRHCESLRLWYEWRELDCLAHAAIRQLEIRLGSGVRVIGLPANPMTARGFSGDVFLDEFAMHADDEAIWAALFPTVLRGEGELDIASTPRGCANMFARLRENPAFGARTLTLSEAVEQGLDVDISGLRAAAGDEWTWRQEFCCEFLDEATAFLTYALIQACQDARLETAIDWPALRRRGAELYAGVDVGRRRDLTVVWLWEREGDRFVTRGVQVLRDCPFDAQEEAIAGILAHRPVARCCIDATGMGLHLAERLAGRFGDFRVERVVFTSGLKNELAGRLRMMAERGHLAIPVDEEISADWHSVARVVTGAGQVRYEADRSRGGHADRFWAAALGLHAAREPGGAPGFVSGGRLTFARTGAW